MAGTIRKAVLRSNSELQQFVLHDVRPTGRVLGVGSYGRIVELEANLVGKQLHQKLLEQGNIDVTKYIEECQVRFARTMGFMIPGPTLCVFFSFCQLTVLQIHARNFTITNGFIVHIHSGPLRTGSKGF